MMLNKNIQMRLAQSCPDHPLDSESALYRNHHCRRAPMRPILRLKRWRPPRRQRSVPERLVVRPPCAPFRGQHGLKLNADVIVDVFSFFGRRDIELTLRLVCAEFDTVIRRRFALNPPLICDLNFVDGIMVVHPPAQHSSSQSPSESNSSLLPKNGFLMDNPANGSPASSTHKPLATTRRPLSECGGARRLLWRLRGGGSTTASGHFSGKCHIRPGAVLLKMSDLPTLPSPPDYLYIRMLRLFYTHLPDANRLDALQSLRAALARRIRRHPTTLVLEGAWRAIDKYRISNPAANAKALRKILARIGFADHILVRVDGFPAQVPLFHLPTVQQCTRLEVSRPSETLLCSSREIVDWLFEAPIPRRLSLSNPRFFSPHRFVDETLERFLSSTTSLIGTFCSIRDTYNAAASSATLANASNDGDGDHSTLCVRHPTRSRETLSYDTAAVGEIRFVVHAIAELPPFDVMIDFGQLTI